MRLNNVIHSYNLLTAVLAVYSVVVWCSVVVRCSVMDCCGSSVLTTGSFESQTTGSFNSLMGKGAFEHHFITYLNGQRRICAPLLLCYHPAATLQASKVISILWLVEVFPFMNNFSWLFNCESRVYQTRSRLVTLYQYL